MKKLLIVGAGGLGRMVFETASLLGYLCAFIDDDTTVSDVCNAEILGKTNKLPKYVGEFEYCICAIGDNILREKLNAYASSLGYIVPNIIHPSAYVSPFAKIGCGNIVLNNVCIQNNAIIGDGVVITANSEIHHDCEIGDYALIYSCSVVRTHSKIGKRAKIGSTVSISNGAVVSDDAVIENGEVIR